MRKLVIVGTSAIGLFTGLCILVIAVATDPDRAPAGPIAPVAATRAQAWDGSTAEPRFQPPSVPPITIMPTPMPQLAPPPAPTGDPELTSQQAVRAQDPAAYRDRRRQDMLRTANRRGQSRGASAAEDD